MRKLLPILALLLLSGCGSVEQSARNVIVASSAVLSTAQSEFKAVCTVAPTQTVCVAINKAGAAENLAIDSLEAYCGFTATSDPSTVCVPVASAQAALQAAVANLNQLITDLKPLLGQSTATAAQTAATAAVKQVKSTKVVKGQVR